MDISGIQPQTQNRVQNTSRIPTARGNGEGRCTSRCLGDGNGREGRDFERTAQKLLGKWGFTPPRRVGPTHRHSLYVDKYLAIANGVVALWKHCAFNLGGSTDLALCLAVRNVAECCQSGDNVLSIAVLTLLVEGVHKR